MSRNDEEAAVRSSEEPAQPVRVLITGSRTWARPDAVWRALDGVITRSSGRPIVLVHGEAARGADRYAASWASQRERDGHAVTAEPHPADWAHEGGLAGFRRNLRMVAAGADLCLSDATTLAAWSSARRSPGALLRLHSRGR